MEVTCVHGESDAIANPHRGVRFNSGNDRFVVPLGANPKIWAEFVPDSATVSAQIVGSAR